MKYTFNLPKSTRETIARRKAILLDTNIWIGLADESEPKAEQLKDRLLILSDKELVFCPLCAPTIWELRKQSGHSLGRTAELMEKLSLNVTFRHIEDIFDKEIEHFLDCMLTEKLKPLSTNEIYGPLLSYLSSGFELHYQNDQITQAQELLSNHLAGMVERTSLTGLLQLLNNQPVPESSNPPPYQEANVRRREAARGNKSRMRRIEQEHVAQSILIPKFNEKRSKLPVTVQLLITAKVSALPKSKKYGTAVEYILKRMPALSSYVQMLTISGYDVNRKNTQQDFYDREIMIYGLSYASVLASVDRWIKSLFAICRQERFPGSMGYISSMSGLGDYLAQMEKKI